MASASLPPQRPPHLSFFLSTLRGRATMATMVTTMLRPRGFTGFHRANMFRDLYPLQLDRERPKPSGFRLILKALTRPFKRALNRLG
ncbi:MAG: hypothetical protein BJ554DRAFT_545 [Olpidium bornovanus]|uniref:Uncharacterized protein n=1 Tax=Olpidium bornovanus TaxID=278681 RepID=A0A8H8A1H8_9FUNG|nr:MAG: hypothetical protein BJ554DRAFT_545 [Olpidium bornovanus]